MAKSKPTTLRDVSDDPVQTYEGALMTATEMAKQQQSAVDAPVFAAGMLEVAESFIVNSPTMYQLAAAELADIVRRRKKLEDARKAITAPMDAAKKAVMELFRGPTDVAEKAEQILRGKVTAYQLEEQKRAAKERADAERQQREEREAAEEKRRKAEQEERDALAAGDPKAAEKAAAAVAESIAAAELAEIAPPPPVIAPPVATGLSFRKKWKGRVIDKLELIRHVAKKPNAGLQNLLEPAQAELDKLAGATKKSMEIPGVEFYEETFSAVR